MQLPPLRPSSSAWLLRLPLLALVMFAACRPMPGRAGSPVADGLYLRTYFAFRQINISSVYLHDGRIAWEPKGGVDPFDFAAAERDTPKTVGTFKVNGNKLDVVWGGGRGAQSLGLEFNKDGSLSALDGGLMSRADAYPKGQRMDAEFSGSLGASGGGSSVGAARSIAFTKDGRFTMATLGTVSTRDTGGISESAYAGTYALSGNTLSLNFADGHAERHTVMPFSTALSGEQAKLGDEQLIYENMSLKRTR